MEALEFRRAPVLMAACWFAVGEVMARRWQPPMVLLLALAACVALTVVALRRSLRLTRVAVLTLAAVWMVVGFWCAEMRPAPSTQQALQSYADGLSRQVIGRVVRVRRLPAEAKPADQDKDVGWWNGKEEEEADAAVGALSVDLKWEDVE